MYYLFQDRPNLCVPTRVSPQRLSNPTLGAEMGAKRATRYLQRYSRASAQFSANGDDDRDRAWTDSD